jgi:hypothetical protein
MFHTYTHFLSINTVIKLIVFIPQRGCCLQGNKLQLLSPWYFKNVSLIAGTQEVLYISGQDQKPNKCVHNSVYKFKRRNPILNDQGSQKTKMKDHSPDSEEITKLFYTSFKKLAHEVSRDHSNRKQDQPVTMG